MSGVTKDKIPKGYRQAEVGVIPEDWKVFYFGDLVNYKKGYAFKSKEYAASGVRIIRVSDTTFNSIEDKGAVYIPKVKADQYRKWALKTNDLIFSTVGSKPPMYDSLVGKAILVSDKYDGSLLNQNAVIIRAKQFSEYFQKLLLNHFRTERYIDYIEVIYRGNANQASITLENLFQYKLPLPSSKKEQTAIANALSDVDALITSLEKLIAKKRAIKTAAMQQLLTGKKRLPPFDKTHTGYKQTELGEIPEDWEVDKLSSVCLMKSGGSITSADIDDSSKYPCYGANGLRGYIGCSTHNGKYALIGRQGALCGNVLGVKGAFFASEHAIVVTPTKQTNIDWLTYVLRRMNLNQYSESSAQPGLSVSKLLLFRIALPEIKEQTLIAKVLSDMDKELKTLETRLNKTQQLKQGMMQELLTGKTRLI